VNTLEAYEVEDNVNINAVRDEIAYACFLAQRHVCVNLCMLTDVFWHKGTKLCMLCWNVCGHVYVNLAISHFRYT